MATEFKLPFFKPKKAATDRLDIDGLETLSDKPMAIPAGFKRPETLAEQVARLVRHERFLEAAGLEDHETFDEADDFDVGDDFDPFSPYEQVFDPVLQQDVAPHDFLKNQEEYRKKYQKKFEEENPIKDRPAVAPKQRKTVDPSPAQQENAD